MEDVLVWIGARRGVACSWYLSFTESRLVEGMSISLKTVLEFKFPSLRWPSLLGGDGRLSDD